MFRSLSLKTFKLRFLFECAVSEYSNFLQIKRSSLKLFLVDAVLVIFAVFCPWGEVYLGRRGGGCHVTEGGLCHVTERGLVIVFVGAVGASRQVIILLFRVLKGLILAKAILKNTNTHCNENPIYVFLSGNCVGTKSQFPLSCVCERFIYSQDRSTSLT
jgi:hypothetical protein